MATKQTIVAICLMLAVLLPEARSAIYKTPKISKTNFAHHRKVEYVPEAKSGVDQKAADPDAGLTTVRQFHFIMITKEEIVAVELHAFQTQRTLGMSRDLHSGQLFDSIVCSHKDGPVCLFL